MSRPPSADSSSRLRRVVLAAGLVLTLPVSATSVVPSPADPAARLAAADPRPFGIALGSTTCEQARRRLGGALDESPGGGVALAVAEPRRWYGGATAIALQCDRPGGPVLRLTLAVRAAEADAHSAFDTFHALERRYPLVAAEGADPRQDGRAVFGRGATRAELVVRAGAEAYDVVYTSAAWRDREAGRALQRELRRTREAASL